MTDRRFTRDELIALARSGVTKVDNLGVRGATLCSVQEIVAMAAVLSTPELLQSKTQPEPMTLVGDDYDPTEYGAWIDCETCSGSGELEAYQDLPMCWACNGTGGWYEEDEMESTS